MAQAVIQLSWRSRFRGVRSKRQVFDNLDISLAPKRNDDGAGGGCATTPQPWYQAAAEIGKRAFNWTSSERFPSASTVGSDLRERR
jgi:hypothetical protein